MADGRNTTNGETRMLANLVRIRTRDPLADERTQLVYVNPIRARSQHQDGPIARHEYQ